MSIIENDKIITDSLRSCSINRIYLNLSEIEDDNNNGDNDNNIILDLIVKYYIKTTDVLQIDCINN